MAQNRKIGFEDVAVGLTGLSRTDVRKIMDEVKTNLARLHTCVQHDFSLCVDPRERLNSRWRCVHCTGEVGVSEKSWYERGLQHGLMKGRSM